MAESVRQTDESELMSGTPARKLGGFLMRQKTRAVRRLQRAIHIRIDCTLRAWITGF